MIPRKKLVLLIGVAFCAIQAVHAGKKESGQRASFQALPRILVFSKTVGFRHASIPDGVKAIQQLGEANNFLVDTTTNANYFNDDSLKNYAAVVFLSTTGNVLNNNQQAAFERYIQAGGGFAGIHSAADTEYEWPWYNTLLGAYFLDHPAPQMAVIEVKNKNHPSTSMLPDRWQRFDEWYNFKSIKPEIRVLATLDETTYNGGKNGADHPIIWYQTLGCGRSWYTALGHTSESYSETLFLQHLLGGIQFAIGNGQACATLPVVLNNFTATLTRTKEVVLSWQTATEQNSDNFSVERSLDQRAFTTLGTVKANGVASSYTFNDVAPARGLNYYRLRQMDKDGRIQYSKMVSVNQPESFTMVVSPNPAKGMIQVAINAAPGEPVMVQVIDKAGNGVYNRKHHGPRFRVDLTGLPSGTYLIRVGEEVKQLLLVK